MEKPNFLFLCSDLLLFYLMISYDILGWPIGHPLVTDWSSLPWPIGHPFWTVWSRWPIGHPWPKCSASCHDILARCNPARLVHLMPLAPICDCIQTSRPTVRLFDRLFCLAAATSKHPPKCQPATRLIWRVEAISIQVFVCSSLVRRWKKRNQFLLRYW